MIHEGDQVCLRSRPIYSSGSRAIYIKGSTLKYGELQESIFSFNEKCRFKIITEEAMNVDYKSSDLTGPSVGSKRPHPSDEEEVDEQHKKEQEEMWSVRDVVFLNSPLSSSPLGSVVKLDGMYAAVLFPSLMGGDSKEEESGGGVKSILSQCRLLRKDDLIVMSSNSTQNDLAIQQLSPKKLKMPSDSTLLALSTDAKGIYTILSNQNGNITCCTFNMELGKVCMSSTFPEPSAHFLSLQLSIRPPLHPPPMKLISLGLSLWLLVDPLGGLYPLAKDSLGAMKQLPLLNLPPVQALNINPYSSKQLLVALVFQPQQLIPLLRQGNLSNLKDFLHNFTPSEVEHYLKEKTHGGCNILHLFGSLASPAQSKAPPPSNARFRPSGLREMMHQALHLASTSSSSAAEAHLWSINMDNNEDDSEEVNEKDEHVINVLSMLRHLTSYSSLFHDTFLELMSQINLSGYTPFMAAVAYKSYSVALYLLELACDISGNDEETLISMIYPHSRHPDDNPLFVLCHNDPCSFTWTGEEHIHQDIFECRTCGLVGSLCCCTECAYTCHRGHDCSFKRASPNAYCDCWEKCPCKALAIGDDAIRYKLLLKLLTLPFLSTRVNGRGEHLLGMLVNIVARQGKEQSQWMGKKSSGSLRHRTSRFEGNPDVPVHNLSPPKFASRALMVVLEEWTCVRAALLQEDSDSPLNAPSGSGPSGGTNEWPLFFSLLEQQRILKSQSHTKYLDVLAYTLLSISSHEIVETLVTTLVQQMGPQRKIRDAVTTCQRFLRSVLRVFVICELEKNGIMEGNSSSSVKKKVSDGDHSVIYKEAMFVMSSLAPLAIPELVLTSRSIIFPVCMGVARPFLSCIMNDKQTISEEMFSLPSISLQRQAKATPVGGANNTGNSSETSSTFLGGAAVGGVGDTGSDSESEVGESEEIQTHGDASSTATIGSGPIPFFSDQESSDGEDLDDSLAEEGSIDGGDMEEESFSLTVPPDQLLLPSSRISGTTHWALSDATTLRRFSKSSARDIYSYNTTVYLLAQSFSSLIRLIAELQSTLSIDGPHPPFVLQPLPSDTDKVTTLIWEGLDKVWVWLSTIMDSTEAQLRLGCALNRTSMLDPPTSINQPQSSSSSSSSGHHRSTDTLGLEGRRGFVNYLLSLMRGESNEHGGVLPALDLSRMEHIALMVDSLVYLLTHSSGQQK
jgi:E3 ubiquitin-protein ligase EDD1